MSFTNISLAVAFGLSCTLTALGQQTCNTRVENAPVIRGFRLGMTLEQVKARIPVVEVKSDQFGYGDVTFFSGANAQLKGAEYAGVKYIVLRFLDGRVTHVTVDYDGLVKWPSPEDFAAKLSETFGLPNAWRRQQPDSPFMDLKCEDFTVTASPNHVSLVDHSAGKTLAKRHAEAEEKKRRNFKP